MHDLKKLLIIIITQYVIIRLQLIKHTFKPLISKKRATDQTAAFHIIAIRIIIQIIPA